MVQTGSYNVNSFSTTSEGEIRRLNAQLDLFWNKEFTLYKRFGLSNGMKIIDCGSGPGYLSEKLLSLLPESNVTAVEMDPSLVAVAEQRLLNYRNAERCSVVNNSILKMDFPDSSFDFAIARLVVEHVPDPEAACRELYRVLKPGGIVVIIDNDFEMHVRTFPHIAELNDLYNAYCKARSDEGGNPKIGRGLPVFLKKTGFSNVDLEIISAHSAVIGDGPFLKSEGPGIPTQLVESGYLEAETYQKIIAKWHEMLKNNEHAIVRQLYVASGRKGSGQTHISVVTSNEKMVHYAPGEKPRIKSVIDAYSALKGNDEFDKVIDLVRNHVSKLLGSVPVDTIKDDIALTDIGIDSEMATDLQESLSSALELQKPLPATLVFDYPTIKAIARFIFERITPPTAIDDSVIPLSGTEKIAEEKCAGTIEELNDEEIIKKLTDKLDSLDRE